MTDVAVGEEVTISEGEALNNFPSKSLGRTFPELIVAMGIEGKSSKRVKGNIPVDPHGSLTEQKTQSKTGDSFAAAMQGERGQAAVQQQDFDPALLGRIKRLCLL